MPSTSFDLAEAVVDYAAGSEANWNSFQLPIPSNIAIFTTDTKKFKRGDGVHKFSELPDGPSIAGIAAGEETIVNVLTTLVPADEDSIIIIDNEIYKPSATKLSDVMARLTAIANKDTIQDSNLAAISSQFSMVDTGIITGDAGKLAIIGSHKMKPGVIPETLVSVAESAIIHIRKFGTYSDKNCTVVCESFTHDSVYYGKIEVCHDNVDTDSLSFALTETNAYVSSEHLGRGVFKITVGKPPIGGNLVLTATATYNADVASVQKMVNITAYSPIIAAVYGGANNDQFYGVAVDSSNNIICVGQTASEGTAGDAFVIKFDSSLGLIARKRYGGINGDQFSAVTVDSADNIICVGYTYSEGTDIPSYNDALVVKFDSNLTIIACKRYGGVSTDQFSAVTVDSADNIICAGRTSSEGSNSDALVVKFDSNLAIVARKRYGGTGADQFNTVAVNSSSNIICAGQTNSEGAGGNDALVVKFDSSLGLIARKRYGGASSNFFQAVAVDSLDNIICAGFTESEGVGSYDAFVIKFDSSLGLIARKRYGGASSDQFNAVVVDSSNNIICSGYTTSEGTSNEAFVIKFDSSLNIVARKRYGGAGVELSYGVAVDSSDNIICAGNTTSEGAGGNDGFILKLPSAVPSGTFTGTILTGLTLADSTLTLADSILTLADSTLTLADSTLTLADSTLTLADSALTLEKDTIEV